MILIAAQTAQASADFSTGVGEIMPMSVVANGLTGSETVDIQVSIDGVNYSPLYDDANGLVQLTATRNIIAIAAPGMFRAVKSATASPIAVWTSAS